MPLDAHVDLYRERRKAAIDLQEEVSLKRTDLALVDLNAETRVITCNLVEVKCYSTVGNLAEYANLKDSIGEQLETSEKVLRLHFDPSLHSPDRIDRSFKTAEFAKLLDFYIDRSARFELLRPDVAEEAKFFVRTIEDGYTIQFTRSALVFDFQKDGTESPEIDDGVEFHRIGVDIIRTLVDEAAKQPIDDTGSSDGVEPSTGGASPSDDPSPKPAASAKDDSESSVPKLEDAVFFVQERDRTVTWDSLTSRNFWDEDSSPNLSFPTKPAPIVEALPTDSDVSHSVVEDDLIREESQSQEPALEAEYTVSPASGVQKIKEAATAKPTEPQTPGNTKPDYDVLLGNNDQAPQYGILGEFAGRKIALDLNQTHTISLFGVQGGGKSYTLGTIAEMATMPISGINELPSPLATVIFHYSPTQDYRPEFTSMNQANSEQWAIEALEKRFGARPKAIEDVLLLVPHDKIEQRRQEYPGVEVQPLAFSSQELQVGHWLFLMGAVGNQLYMRQLKSIMRGMRDNMTLDGLRSGIDASSMQDGQKERAHERLDIAAPYIDDSSVLGSYLRPGRLVIVDLRDEFIGKDEALGLFVVLLQLFGDAKHEGRKFNKLVVFDEAHKYIDSAELVSGLVEVVREMRHKGTSVMVASQDPPSVPLALIELSTQIILHRFNSPAWIKYIQKANAALHALTPEKMAQLRQGEAYVWSSKATDDSFSRDAMKVQCRPRVTLHGGATKTAVD